MTAKYAGIGSRSTPEAVLTRMTGIASALESHGIVLRSGGARGADHAFERGVESDGMKEIFLPWRLFNNNASGRYVVSEEAERWAAEHHPAWHNCNPAARKLHARNSHIVLGENLDDPVDFVVCWTPGATEKGGTGQALRIARRLDIPVFNLANENFVIEFGQFLADFNNVRAFKEADHA